MEPGNECGCKDLNQVYRDEDGEVIDTHAKVYEMWLNPESRDMQDHYESICDKRNTCRRFVRGMKDMLEEIRMFVFRVHLTNPGKVDVIQKKVAYIERIFKAFVSNKLKESPEYCNVISESYWPVLNVTYVCASIHNINIGFDLILDHIETCATVEHLNKTISVTSRVSQAMQRMYLRGLFTEKKE